VGTKHGVPKLPEGEKPVNELLGWTAATASPQIDVALSACRSAVLSDRPCAQYCSAACPSA
jgi:hypothetical protein